MIDTFMAHPADCNALAFALPPVQACRGGFWPVSKGLGLPAKLMGHRWSAGPMQPL